jgi:hypothetical protein
MLQVRTNHGLGLTDDLPEPFHNLLRHVSLSDYLPLLEKVQFYNFQPNSFTGGGKPIKR